MSKKVLNDYLMCQEYGHLVKYLVHGISTICYVLFIYTEVALGWDYLGIPNPQSRGSGMGIFHFGLDQNIPGDWGFLKSGDFFPKDWDFLGIGIFFVGWAYDIPVIPKKNPPLFIYIYENLVILKKFLLDIKFFCKTVLAKILWTRQFVD